jgi:tRNA-specific 2-thiouridylase
MAMSGGVDSSVAAYLLRREGYEVIGLFMRTGAHGDEVDESSHKKGCCSAVDAADARRVADQLDIPFYALDFEKEFSRIMDYFTDEYLNGRTPNPCVMCNNWLKFGKLWSYGKQLAADYVATGHYAQVVPQDGEYALWRSSDPDKDQSYVLFGLERSLLPHLRFPIGHLRKEQVRQVAREAGLRVSDKPDSVEICFVPDQQHGDFIRRRRPGTDTSGFFVDPAGDILGEHPGIENFTIGQRKGLGVAFGERRYVLRIVPEERKVVLGQREELLANGLRAIRLNWLIDLPPTDRVQCQAKIRYRHQPVGATVSPDGNGGADVMFSEPQPAVTPGQGVVFYDGNRVLGGGWIESAI